MSDHGTIHPPIYYSRPPAAPAPGPAQLHQVLLRDWVAAALFPPMPHDEDADAWSLDDDDGDLAERLADLEQRVAHIEAFVAPHGLAVPCLPEAASIAESLSRIADAMAPAPAPADIVGSPYVAKRWAAPPSGLRRWPGTATSPSTALLMGPATASRGSFTAGTSTDGSRPDKHF